MKKTKRHPALKNMKIKPDTTIELNVHDDNCPFPEGQPCICTPKIVEVSAAQLVQLSAEPSIKTLGELVGYGKTTN